MIGLLLERVAHPVMPLAHCPHCSLRLTEEARLPYPREPMRCPHCQLVVGAGRALGTSADAQGGTGAAAGRRAAVARRSDLPTRDPAEFVDDLCRAASMERSRSTRELTMLEYDRLSQLDGSLPALDEVLGAFGSWNNVVRSLRSQCGQRRRGTPVAAGSGRSVRSAGRFEAHEE